MAKLKNIFEIDVTFYIKLYPQTIWMLLLYFDGNADNDTVTLQWSLDATGINHLSFYNKNDQSLVLGIDYFDLETFFFRYLTYRDIEQTFLFRRTFGILERAAREKKLFDEDLYDDFNNGFNHPHGIGFGFRNNDYIPGFEDEDEELLYDIPCPF